MEPRQLFFENFNNRLKLKQSNLLGKFKESILIKHSCFLSIPWLFLP